ncbi:hypothetical protein Droror1_Dr00002335 [Drosera rotundifolia]
MQASKTGVLTGNGIGGGNRECGESVSGEPVRVGRRAAAVRCEMRSKRKARADADYEEGVGGSILTAEPDDQKLDPYIHMIPLGDRMMSLTEELNAEKLRYIQLQRRLNGVSKGEEDETMITCLMSSLDDV